jgi:TonB family protein
MPARHNLRPVLLLALLAGLSVSNSSAGSNSPTGVLATLHTRVGAGSCELAQRATLVIAKQYAFVRIEGKTEETYSLEMGPEDYLEIPASAPEKVTKEARQSGFSLKSESQPQTNLPNVRALRGNASCPGLDDASTEADRARDQRRRNVQGKLYKAGAEDVTMPVGLKQEPPESDPRSSSTATSDLADASRKRNGGGNGIVSLIVLIDVDGSVKQTKLVRSSNPDLDKKAADAVARWRFEPARRKGLPVAGYIPVEINFHLQ